MAYAFNEDKSKVDLLDFIYPVGSIYMSVNNTNPGNLFGGTWTAWGSGRVPVGVDTSDTNFNTVEKTGGASTVTLTTQQIPSHSHDQGGDISAMGTPNQITVSESTTGTSIANINAAELDMPTSNTGGGQAHTNIQPYITCYMWKRTA